MSDTPGRQGSLSVGFGGWVCYRATDVPEPIFVRLTEASDGRLEVADLFIPFESAPSARSFRTYGEHLSRIDAQVNAEEVATAFRLRLRLGGPGPDLRTAASYYAVGHTDEDHWAALMLRSQGKGEDVAPSPRRRLPSRPKAGDEADLSLVAPTGRPFPDGFYAEVARVYGEAASQSERPAAWIAEVNDVPVKTVHRWVAEARKRRHLPPGRKGRAG